MKSIAGRISSFHRVLLVLSSIALGVVGSRVATDPTEWPSWALLIGCGCLLFVADVGRHVDEKGRTIATAAKMPLDSARRDVASTSEARAVALASLGATLAVLAAIALELLL
jgi:hypothetical protein